MAYQWKLADGELPKIEAGEFNLSPLAIKLLSARGIVEPEEIREFLEPSYGRDVHDPYQFKSMKTVVDRIFLAINRQENIALYGDYDADGVCSAAVLATSLQALGGKIAEVYLPHREKEGYGLNIPAIEYLAKRGATLLITLDCGTTNINEILHARELGLEVIVIDHHHVPESLPGTLAILNPKMPDETYPFKYLASVGMSFKVVQALLIKKRQDSPDEFKKWQTFEKWLLDLVAIATVTDLVPLRGENRTLLKYGLVVLNQTPRPGLRALVRAMGGEFGELTAREIGFQIGPRLNAAGRMDHANAAYSLLMCDEPKKAEGLALDLNKENQKRQKLTEEITSEAMQQLEGQLDNRVLVAEGSDWPIGLVGLVASRIMEKYNRPILVISRSKHGLSGSARSIPAFNIITALESMQELFIKFGGHAQACGFTLKSDEALTEMMKRLNELAGTQLTENDLAKVLNIDAALKLQDVQWETQDIIEKFAPFGMRNPNPIFLFPRVRAVGVGSVGANGQHLKLTLADDEGNLQPAIGFRLGAESANLHLGDMLDVVAEITVNKWNGNKTLQLQIIDFRSSVK